jgi:hypothetical protein
MNKLITLLLLSLLSVSVFAARFPSYYPSDIGYVGVVESVDRNGNSMVINGKRFPLSGNLVIHTLRDQYVGIDAINPGAKITFRIEKIGDNSYMLIEIWQLPDNYQLNMG